MRMGCWELGKMQRRWQSSKSRTFPLVLCARLLVTRQCEVAGSCASGGFRGACRLSRQSQGRTDSGFGRMIAAQAYGYHRDLRRGWRP